MILGVAFWIYVVPRQDICLGCHFTSCKESHPALQDVFSNRAGLAFASASVVEPKYTDTSTAPERYAGIALLAHPKINYISNRTVYDLTESYMSSFMRIGVQPLGQ